MERRVGWVVTHLWNLLIKDAEDTLRHTCRAVLEDADTPQEQRTQLAEGVLEIARIFQVCMAALHGCHAQWERGGGFQAWMQAVLVGTSKQKGCPASSERA